MTTGQTEELQNFTSQDLQKMPSRVQEAALKAPIVITHHRRRRLVMLSVEEFDRLQKLAAGPQAFKLEELDDEIVSEIASAKMGARHNKLNQLMSGED